MNVDDMFDIKTTSIIGINVLLQLPKQRVDSRPASLLTMVMSSAFVTVTRKGNGSDEHCVHCQRLWSCFPVAGLF